MKIMLIYAYMMYLCEIFGGCELDVENKITHNLLMLHVVLIMHVT